MCVCMIVVLFSITTYFVYIDSVLLLCAVINLLLHVNYCLYKYTYIYAIFWMCI